MSDNKAVARPATGALMTRSIIADMAERFGMEKEAFQATLMKTIMPGNSSNEQVAAFLIVAKNYDLNPFTKEIYAFPTKGGGVMPMVPIDGWLKIINSNPHYDGCDFKDHVTDGELSAITCRMYHKHRSHPIEVTEYMAECKGNTDPWRRWPARMLRHKAMIQAGRYAFGFSGIVDPDEAERTAESESLPPVGAGVSGLKRMLSKQTDKAAEREQPARDAQSERQPDASEVVVDEETGEILEGSNAPADPNPEPTDSAPRRRTRPATNIE